MKSQDEAKTAIYEFLTAIGRYGGFDQDRIKNMLGNGIEDEHANVGLIWEFHSSIGSFMVSRYTGHVVSYSKEDTETLGEMKLDEATALECGKRLILAISPGFQFKLFAEDTELITKGYYELDFHQVLQRGEISIFPNFVTIIVRGDTGEITYFCRSDLSFIRCSKPRITKRQARRIAQARIGRTGGVIYRQELFEHAVDKGMHAITVWAISVDFKTPTGASWVDLIMINADTGELVDMEDDEWGQGKEKDPFSDRRTTYVNLILPVLSHDFRQFKDDQLLPVKAVFESMEWCRHILLPQADPYDEQNKAVRAYHIGDSSSLDLLEHKVTVDSVACRIIEASSFFLIILPAESFPESEPIDKANHAVCLLLKSPVPIKFKQIESDTRYRSFSSNEGLAVEQMVDWSERVDGIFLNGDIGIIVYKASLNKTKLYSNPHNWFEEEFKKGAKP